MQEDTRREWILEVEDNRDIWTILNIMLPQAFPQMRFVHVADEAAALARLHVSNPPQYGPLWLILQDYYVPDRATGLRLVQAFKQAGSPYQQVPLIMMSSSASQQDIQDIMWMGADSFLAKPINIEEWLTVLQPLQSYWQP